MTTGPTMSGRSALIKAAAHPPWQLPIIAGFSASGCRKSNLFDELHPCLFHIGNGLTGTGSDGEGDEVDRMTGIKGDTGFQSPFSTRLFPGAVCSGSMITKGLFRPR